MLIPVSMESRDLGWRVRIVFGWCEQFKAFAAGLWKPDLVIIAKSKDRFMEQPPMKIVQPWAYMDTAWRSMW
jgi:hypothetical protein